MKWCFLRLKVVCVCVSGAFVCCCRAGWSPIALLRGPGAGPKGRHSARVLAGGLRLVTEGYSGVPPLPPTSSGSPRGHKSLRNLRCFLRVVLKNIVFYGVSGPSAFRNFILALSKNHAFYVVLGFRGGGPRNGKNDMLKVF